MEKERCQCYICPFEALSQGEFLHHLKHKHKIILKKVGSTTTATLSTTATLTTAATEQAVKVETHVSEHLLQDSTTTLLQQQELKVPCSDLDLPDFFGSPLQQQQQHQEEEDDTKIVQIKEEFYDCVLSDGEDFALDQDSNGGDEFDGDDGPDVDDLGDNERVDDDSALLVQLHAQELRDVPFVKIKGFCCKFCPSFKTTDIQQMKAHQLSCSSPEGGSFIA